MPESTNEVPEKAIEAASTAMCCSVPSDLELVGPEWINDPMADEWADWAVCVLAAAAPHFYAAIKAQQDQKSIGVGEGAECDGSGVLRSVEDLGYAKKESTRDCPGCAKCDEDGDDFGEWLTDKGRAHDSASIDQPSRKTEHEGAARAFREAAARFALLSAAPEPQDCERLLHDFDCPTCGEPNCGGECDESPATPEPQQEEDGVGEAAVEALAAARWDKSEASLSGQKWRELTGCEDLKRRHRDDARADLEELAPFLRPATSPPVLSEQAKQGDSGPTREEFKQALEILALATFEGVPLPDDLVADEYERHGWLKTGRDQTGEGFCSLTEAGRDLIGTVLAEAWIVPGSEQGEAKLDRCPSCGSRNRMFTQCNDPGQFEEEHGHPAPEKLQPGCPDPWHDVTQPAREQGEAGK